MLAVIIICPQIWAQKVSCNGEMRKRLTTFSAFPARVWMMAVLVKYVIIDWLILAAVKDLGSDPVMMRVIVRWGAESDRNARRRLEMMTGRTVVPSEAF